MADSLGRPDETLTRRAVARYAVLDTPADPAFDELVDLARTVTGAPAGGIGFLDRERIWFKSHRGLVAAQSTRAEFPVPWGAGEPAAERERRTCAGVVVREGGFLLGGEAFAFCAGAPIVTGEGYQIGQLFVLDPRSRSLDDGQLTALTVLARQVTIGLELRRTMMSYRAAVDGVGHVVLQVDEQHRLLSVTPTWSQLTGFGVVRSIGRPLLEFVHAGDRVRVLAHLEDLHHRNVAATFECRLSRLVGGDVPVEVIARPVIDEAGCGRGLVGVIADISDRKSREVEAQHAQKLEALGRLSSGLAHEINTPIQFVGDNTRFLAASCEAMLTLITAYREQIAAGGGQALPVQCREAVRQAETDADLDFIQEEIPSAIRQSLDGVERVATLIRAMKTFSTSGHEGQAPADLNDALQSAVTIALTQVKDVADIGFDLGDLPMVMCMVGDLNQVFLNMLVNAADAIEESGRRGSITVRTRCESEHAVIEIADTGAGIPQEVQARIFEPFFTTKEVGRGTGQGLALARAVIQDRHGGTISVATTVGEGTTFTLTIPVAGRPPAPGPGG